MKIDTSGLQNWLDPVAVADAGAELCRTGGEYGEAVLAADNTWQNLRSSYNSPHQDEMYRALRPAVDCSEIVSNGCISVGMVMTILGDGVSGLTSSRDDLLREVKEHEAKPEEALQDQQWEPGQDYFARQDHAAAGREIQDRINSLVREYEGLVDDAASGLRHIGDDGLGEADSSYWSDVSLGTAITVVTFMVERVGVDDVEVTQRYFIEAYGQQIELRPLMHREKSYFIDWTGVLGPDGSAAAEGRGFLDRFKAELDKAYMGEPTYVNRGAPGTGVRYNPDERYPEISVEERVRTRSGASNWRMAGNAIGFFGTGALVVGELLEADRRLREERPELSQEERHGEALRIAAVRSASQVIVEDTVTRVASAAVGAAIGTAVCPGVGTAIGLAIGVTVGLAANIPTGDDKSAGDRVADVGEAAVDGIVDFFSGSGG